MPDAYGNDCVSKMIQHRNDQSRQGYWQLFRSLFILGQFGWKMTELHDAFNFIKRSSVCISMNGTYVSDSRGNGHSIPRSWGGNISVLSEDTCFLYVNEMVKLQLYTPPKMMLASLEEMVLFYPTRKAWSDMLETVCLKQAKVLHTYLTFRFL